MDFFPISTPEVTSPAWLRLDPAARGHWLSLVGFCAAQENGGVIEACRSWDGRDWDRACGLGDLTTLLGLVGAGLVEWQGDDLVVAGYPRAAEEAVQKKRAGGRIGGQRRAANASGSPSSIPSSYPSGSASTSTETATRDASEDPSSTPSRRSLRSLKEDKEDLRAGAHANVTEDVRALAADLQRRFVPHTNGVASRKGAAP